MVNRNDIILKLKELKPILLRDYSVTKIGLFGSFADETFTEESDIDLLVEFERPIGWKFFTLEIYLEKIFNRKIDIVTKNSLKEQLRENILKRVNYV